MVPSDELIAAIIFKLVLQQFIRIPKLRVPEQEQKILRVEIDGAWTASEFSTSLRSITDVYGLRTILALEQQGLEEFLQAMRHWQFPRMDPRWFEQQRSAFFKFGIPYLATALINASDTSDALRLLQTNEQLYVAKIQFASPGLRISLDWVRSLVTSKSFYRRLST